jgi:hypothetical protein
MDPARPRAQAVAVSGNRIAFVGSAAEALAWRGPHTEVVDAGGRTLLPGFEDFRRVQPVVTVCDGRVVFRS